jgi:hypothetical protein
MISAGKGCSIVRRPPAPCGRGVTIEELLLIVNAVADACSDNDVDIDRLLDLTWAGVRPAADAF